MIKNFIIFLINNQAKMENNYFFDLPEDLQQMIFEKEHKIKMQDVFEEINELEDSIKKWIFRTILVNQCKYGKKYTKKLVGKEMWDSFLVEKEEWIWSQIVKQMSEEDD